MSEEQLRASLKEYKVPEHLHGGIVRYVISGIQPGSFLCNVLSNNLHGAILGADEDTTIDDFRGLMTWLYWQAPSPCHGSVVKMTAWMDAKRKEFGIEARP